KRQTRQCEDCSGNSRSFRMRLWKFRSQSGSRGMRVAPGGPFLVEVAVFAHQAHFRVFSIGAKLLRGVDGEKLGLVLGFVGAVFAVAESDQPLVLDFIVDDEISSCRHEYPLARVSASTHLTSGRV